jgi:hypothetical protein
MWPIVIDSTGCSCGVPCRGSWLILKIIINRDDRAMIAVTVKVGSREVEGADVSGELSA